MSVLSETGTVDAGSMTATLTRVRLTQGNITTETPVVPGRCFTLAQRNFDISWP